ncbi:hypothetical protein [Streptosporangium sp. NPDC049644]|uniref:hypothetical protein n=1 Tax=Streptosporangium sp. NPDC049644 TaxID=3155507 RepID=UPI00341E902C
MSLRKGRGKAVRGEGRLFGGAQALDDALRGDPADPAAHAVTDGVHIEMVALP